MLAPKDLASTALFYTRPNLELLHHPPTIMSTSAEQNSKQSEPNSQSSQAISATNETSIQEIRGFGDNELLQWIQQKEPTLVRGENVEKFKAEHITGRAFLKHAGDVDFYKMKCKLPPVLSDDLADLASEIIGWKSKYYRLHHTLHATAS